MYDKNNRWVEPDEKAQNYEQTLHIALLGHTADLLRFAVESNVELDRLGRYAQTFYAALRNAATPAEEPVPEPIRLTKRQIADAVQLDSILCFEDGKRFRSMKRHLRVHFNLTPDEYRAKWGLPDDFPMVAPGYSVQRSEMAKASGLGRK